MQAPSDAADWTVALFTGALALVSTFQLWFLRRADVTARTAADAARQSAEAAIMAQRPWLHITATICEPLTVDDNGARLGFRITVQNLGKSPATQALIYTEMVPNAFGDGLSNAVAEMRRFTAPIRAATLPIGFSVFPTEVLTHQQKAVIRKEQLEACENRASTAPGVAIGVIYKFAGGQGLTIVTCILSNPSEGGALQHVDLTRPITPAGFLALNRSPIEAYAD